MKTRNQSKYHNVRLVGKQGGHSPKESDHPGVEKCTNKSTTSLEKHSDGDQAQVNLPAGPSRVTQTRKKEKYKRQKWSREDYKEVTYAFYMSLKNPAGSHTENTFSIWRSCNLSNNVVVT